MTSNTTPRASKKNAKSFDVSSALTVCVGKEPKQQNFLLHEGMICGRSEFFHRAMNGNWAEKDTRTVKLPEDDPASFGIYVNLVYTNQVTTREEISPERKPSSSELRREYATLSKLYVLCEKLQDTAAKNAVVKAIFAVATDHNENGRWTAPTKTAVEIIYAGTSEKSPVRRLMVDLITRCRSPHLLKRRDRLPYDFVLDVAVALHPGGGNRSNVRHSDGSAAYLERENQESEAEMGSSTQAEKSDQATADS